MAKKEIDEVEQRLGLNMTEPRRGDDGFWYVGDFPYSDKQEAVEHIKRNVERVRKNKGFSDRVGIVLGIASFVFVMWLFFAFRVQNKSCWT